MESTLLRLSYNIENIHEAVKQFWHIAAPHYTMVFSGDMGAGKTTFIHNLCDYLRVEDAVSSPTFALINEYHFPQSGKDTIIYHMDWYRIKDEEEAINAGIEYFLSEAKNERAYCFVEWPEKATALLEAPYLWLSITSVSREERNMDVILVTG